jgi:hypothetical protein
VNLTKKKMFGFSFLPNEKVITITAASIAVFYDDTKIFYKSQLTLVENLALSENSNIYKKFYYFPARRNKMF